MSWRDPILRGIQAGKPEIGPTSVHIDITNSCNAACVTCWDHSPLLLSPRDNAWKRQRLPLNRFHAIIDQLIAFKSVRHIVLSGMGEPFTHPGVYEMIARIAAIGWELTVITNLVAADPDKMQGITQLLVGVQGVTPSSYLAFHPGWTEEHFFKMCRTLRKLSLTPIRIRHVQVINRDTAPEVVEMVRFAKTFGADRVNYKLASLHSGTETTQISESQRDWLLAEAIPQARELSNSIQIHTNLDLFEQQVSSGGRSTAPIATIGCSMGYVFTRITVDEQVLFCCNTAIPVGSLHHESLVDLWFGETWQQLRDQLDRGSYFSGCDQCGKFEQNVKWAAIRSKAASATDRPQEDFSL